MKIIPVMDVLGGVVVHAVKGERSNYKPLKSLLCSNPNPLDVALAFKKLGFKTLYLADLDAIVDNVLDVSLIKVLGKVGFEELMVDVGVYSYTKPEKILENGASKIVVGTETLYRLENLKSLLKKINPEKIVVSLDYKNKILTKAGELEGLGLDEAAFRLQNLGVKTLMFIDLSKVGSGEGVNLNLVKKILGVLNIPLIVGGGIRDMGDILSLKRMGVSGVLVATALHKGKIRKEEIASLV
ncbi:MAG: HisA/HisF family protein [Candidatus Hecatellales archaeon]|nr:MAG: HisA/HisF family protein [Candidatus Hecatellales archaeon]